MRLLSLFGGRLAASLRDLWSLSIILLAIVVATTAGWYSREKQAGVFRVAVINRDAGNLGEQLVEMLRAEADLQLVAVEEEQARLMLRQDRLQCLFIIREDFSARLQERDYKELVELMVAPGSAYGSAVSEPLVNGIMKLWFEQQARYDLHVFLAQRGLAMSPQEWETLKKNMEKAWQEGAKISVLRTEPSAQTNRILEMNLAQGAQNHSAATTALSWYGVLSLFYLIAGGSWIAESGKRGLLARAAHTGVGHARFFLIQAGASLAVVLGGFVLTGLLGGEGRRLPALLPHLFLYGAGCLGMSLAVCSLCRHLTPLLFAAPVVSLSAGVLSGLLMPLPDWAAVWVVLSGVLPGRWLHAALSGAPKPVWGFATAVGWLAAGLLFSYLGGGYYKKENLCENC
ncbi:MAG: ABC transporter permease [Clostridia bacterium]|nr:ABC transporter permease [Clostridia bacterium]